MNRKDNTAYVTNNSVTIPTIVSENVLYQEEQRCYRYNKVDNHYRGRWEQTGGQENGTSRIDYNSRGRGNYDNKERTQFSTSDHNYPEEYPRRIVRLGRGNYDRYGTPYKIDIIDQSN